MRLVLFAIIFIALVCYGEGWLVARYFDLTTCGWYSIAWYQGAAFIFLQVLFAAAVLSVGVMLHDALDEMEKRNKLK